MFSGTRASASDLQFFRVINLELHSKPGSRPLIEVEVETRKRIRSDQISATVYFFGRDRKPVGKPAKPIPMGGRWEKHSLPAFFEAQRKESLFFPVPDKLPAASGWTALAVFGDQNGAAAETLPRGEAERLEYPERELVRHPKLVERKEAMDPLTELVVKTRSQANPQLTLFMCPPKGMTQASEARGVLAMCVLANNLDEIRRQLRMEMPNKDISPVLKFADREKLVVLCWGSRQLWDAGANWDDMDRDRYKAMDRELDCAAEAWSRGVKELSDKYGMPSDGFLLWGFCASGQYAMRLALRVPEHFLAVYAHIPSSYDRPVDAANRILWCLTTGELDSGYERSLRFFQQARDAGYPIVYKAIIGLGHGGHPAAEAMVEGFYKYALSLREDRARFDKLMQDPFSKERREREKGQIQPWPEGFRNPAFVGDVVNQAAYPAEQLDMVPQGFRVALPTKELADIWAMSDKR